MPHDANPGFVDLRATWSVTICRCARAPVELRRALLLLDLHDLRDSSSLVDREVEGSLVLDEVAERRGGGTPAPSEDSGGRRMGSGGSLQSFGAARAAHRPSLGFAPSPGPRTTNLIRSLIDRRVQRAVLQPAESTPQSTPKSTHRGGRLAACSGGSFFLGPRKLSNGYDRESCMGSFVADGRYRRRCRGAPLDERNRSGRPMASGPDLEAVRGRGPHLHANADPFRR